MQKCVGLTLIDDIHTPYVAPEICRPRGADADERFGPMRWIGEETVFRLNSAMPLH